MLTGYILILLVPMLVIVPFSAFRSLAAEREDGTFELLSITALNARQIVSGKLGSAVLQMIVYYSALGPCIAFTYLLRGIDILTILLLLYYAFLLSTLLSALGLLVATASRSRHWQVLLSVALVIALVVADIFASWAGGAVIWVAGSIPYDDVYFWLVQLAVLMFCLSYLVLFVLSAAAQISFASDNRSTKLRVVLVVQHLLWVFWMTFLWIETRENDVLYAMVPFGALHWFAGRCLSPCSGGCAEPGSIPDPERVISSRSLMSGRWWFSPLVRQSQEP
jgi:ABC-type transport system involved in cytochrome c biogenesis permease component